MQTDSMLSQPADVYLRQVSDIMTQLRSRMEDRKITLLMIVRIHIPLGRYLNACDPSRRNEILVGLGILSADQIGTSINYAAAAQEAQTLVESPSFDPHRLIRDASLDLHELVFAFPELGRQTLKAIDHAHCHD